MQEECFNKGPVETMDICWNENFTNNCFDIFKDVFIGAGAVAQ